MTPLNKESPLLVDVPLAEVSAESPSIGIANGFILVGDRYVRGDHRRYYLCAGDRRLLLVLRNGLTLGDLPIGSIVDANVGYDRGDASCALPGEVGHLHTKLTVYRRLPTATDGRSLATIIRQSPERRSVDALP